MGHCSPECNANNLREQKEIVALVGNWGPAHVRVPDPPVTVPALALAQTIQPVAYVDVTNEELGVIYSTDPVGTMMMSTKLVEVVQEEVKMVELAKQKKLAMRMEAIMDSFSEEKRACLVAMADKRNRSIDEELSQAGLPLQRFCTEASLAYAPRREQQPVQQQPSPQQAVQQQPSPLQPIQQPLVPPKEPQANLNVYYQPQGRPFIPDPFFERPENQYQP